MDRLWKLLNSFTVNTGTSSSSTRTTIVLTTTGIVAIGGLGYYYYTRQNGPSTGNTGSTHGARNLLENGSTNPSSVSNGTVTTVSPPVSHENENNDELTTDDGKEEDDDEISEDGDYDQVSHIRTPVPLSRSSSSLTNINSPVVGVSQTDTSNRNITSATPLNTGNTASTFATGITTTTTTTTNATPALQTTTITSPTPSLSTVTALRTAPITTPIPTVNRSHSSSSTLMTRSSSSVTVPSVTMTPLVLRTPMDIIAITPSGVPLLLSPAIQRISIIRPRLSSDQISLLILIAVLLIVILSVILVINIGPLPYSPIVTPIAWTSVGAIAAVLINGPEIQSSLSILSPPPSTHNRRQRSRIIKDNDSTNDELQTHNVRTNAITATSALSTTPAVITTVPSSSSTASTISSLPPRELHFGNNTANVATSTEISTPVSTTVSTPSVTVPLVENMNSTPVPLSSNIAMLNKGIPESDDHNNSSVPNGSSSSHSNGDEEPQNVTMSTKPSTRQRSRITPNTTANNVNNSTEEETITNPLTTPPSKHHHHHHHHSNHSGNKTNDHSTTSVSSVDITSLPLHDIMVLCIEYIDKIRNKEYYKQSWQLLQTLLESLDKHSSSSSSSNSNITTTTITTVDSHDPLRLLILQNLRNIQDTVNKLKNSHEKEPYDAQFWKTITASSSSSSSLSVYNPYYSGIRWRLAAITLSQGMGMVKSGNNQQKTDSLHVFRTGLSYILQSLQDNEADGEAHKYAAILYAKAAASTSEQIANAYKIRDHALRATQIKSTDPLIHYVLGVWCYEVTSLPWLSRKAASAIFGTPPTSTYEDALQHLHRAEMEAERAASGHHSSLSPSSNHGTNSSSIPQLPGSQGPQAPWMSNRLKLAQTYYALGRTVEAREWLTKTNQLTPGTADDEKTTEEIKKLAKALGM